MSLASAFTEVTEAREDVIHPSSLQFSVLVLQGIGEKKEKQKVGIQLWTTRHSEKPHGLVHNTPQWSHQGRVLEGYSVL